MKYKLDLERFWRENAECIGKPFRTDKPRAPIELPVDDHWLDELKDVSSIRYFKNPDYQREVNRRGNDCCEHEIGIRPFDETVLWPPPKRIEEVFGARQECFEGSTPWLIPGIETIDDLVRLLDQVERMDLADFVFQDGVPPYPDRHRPNGEPTMIHFGTRGPATIGTSACGTERMVWFLIDYPAVMERFYELLAQKLVEYAQVIAQAAGVCIRGYSWLDDHCALLSPPYYERFCFPVFKHIFDTFAPEPGNWRYQHSDSNMAHLLPILARLNLSAVNFGPTVRALDIRRHMPRTVVEGEIAPFTLRNGSDEEIIAEVQRDFDAAGADGGLVVTTAGSIAAGTTFERIRYLMWAVEQYTRYDTETEEMRK